MAAECNMNDRESLMNEIMALNFAIVDLNLYLNTHPCDAAALNFYNCYVMRLMILIERYQRMYGPITMGTFQSRCPWQWVEGDWPWEK